MGVIYHGVGSTTLPQNLATTDTPQFAGLGIGAAGASNKIVGVTTLTIAAGGSGLVETTASASGTAFSNITGLRVINTDQTINNWVGVVFADAEGSQAVGGIGFKVGDHTNNYSSQFGIGGRTSAGYAQWIYIDANGVSVGATSLNASAILELTSTTRGMLMPRMTTAQRDAISSPATGLEIYNTTTNVPNIYNGTGWYFPTLMPA